MLVTVLVENETESYDLGAQHGLSLLIESSCGTILFDTGKDDLFSKNAQTLKKSIDAVDFAVVSHGHYDHGGGLEIFLRQNDHAPVYIRQSAFEPHFSRRSSGQTVSIGLDSKLLQTGRFILTGELEKPAPGVVLFSDVTERELFSGCNGTILMDQNGAAVPDDFRHEQNLLLCEGEKAVLFAGCAHSGIVNILRRAEQILGRMPDVVIGGFHLFSASTGKSEPEEIVKAIGRELDRSGAVCYTGHCTGSNAFALLKQQLSDRLHTMHAGTIIELS